MKILLSLILLTVVPSCSFFEGITGKDSNKRRTSKKTTVNPDKIDPKDKDIPIIIDDKDMSLPIWRPAELPYYYSSDHYQFGTPLFLPNHPVDHDLRSSNEYRQAMSNPAAKDMLAYKACKKPEDHPTAYTGLRYFQDLLHTRNCKHLANRLGQLNRLKLYGGARFDSAEILQGATNLTELEIWFSSYPDSDVKFDWKSISQLKSLKFLDIVLFETADLTELKKATNLMSLKVRFFEGENIQKNIDGFATLTNLKRLVVDVSDGPASFAKLTTLKNLEFFSSNRGASVATFRSWTKLRGYTSAYIPIAVAAELPDSLQFLDGSVDSVRRFKNLRYLTATSLPEGAADLPLQHLKLNYIDVSDIAEFNQALKRKWRGLLSLTITDNFDINRNPIVCESLTQLSELLYIDLKQTYDSKCLHNSQKLAIAVFNGHDIGGFSDLPKLKWLRAETDNATELSSGSLQQMFLKGKVGKLSDLGNMPALKKLKIQSDNLAENQSLEKLPGLVVLDLSGHKLEKSTWSNAHELKALLLDRTDAIELPNTSQLPELAYLGLSDHKISSIKLSGVDVYTNLEVLDLKSRELKTIDLSNFTQLYRIGLDDLFVNDEIKFINLPNYSSDLTVHQSQNASVVLQGLPNLAGLQVKGDSGFDIDWNFPNMNRLHIIGVSSPVSLESMTRLTELEVSGANVSAEPLALPFVEKLSLHNISLLNLSMPNLLYYDNGKLPEGTADLGRISNSKKLDFLDISLDHNVLSLAPLGGLHKLKTLRISAFEPIDFNPVANLNSLERLTLYNYSPDFGGWGNVTSLRNLHLLRLSDVTQDDFNAILNMSKLDTLGLSNSLSVFNGIDSLVGIERLSTLRALNISDHTLVTDISPIVPLAATIKYLTISNTGITDISALSQLSELKSFSMASTEITDITPLGSLRDLEYFSGNNSPIAPETCPTDALSEVIREFCNGL